MHRLTLVDQFRLENCLLWFNRSVQSSEWIHPSTTALSPGSLYSLDWTGLLDWTTGLDFEFIISSHFFNLNLNLVVHIIEI